MNKISLSAASRTNLLTLQNTANLIGRTQDRLASGLAVKAPTDDAVKYFTAKSLTERADSLNERKDAIDQGVSALEATLHATDALDKLVTQMKGIINTARSQTTVEQRKTSQTQLGDLVSQIQKLVDDASYKGLNLLNSTGSILSVRFSDKSDSKLDVTGVNFGISTFYQNSDGSKSASMIDAKGSSVMSALAISGGDGTNGAVGLTGYTLTLATEAAQYAAALDSAILQLEATHSNLRSKAATMAMNSDILKVRLDFTREYTTVLGIGADKLTLADLNNEGANLLALQTRQQLGVQALSFAGQSEQAVLSLFR